MNTPPNDQASEQQTTQSEEPLKSAPQLEQTPQSDELASDTAESEPSQIAAEPAFQNEPLTLGFDSIAFEPLSEHYPKLNAFSSFIGWAIIALIMLIVDLAVDKINLHFLVLSGLFLFAFLSAVHGYYSAKACGYFQDQNDIFFKQGLWWKRQTALNFSRIQHIDISHGPLERRYKMATIKFFTAGGAASDLRIAGLPNEKAEQIRADILEYAKQNVIADELPEINSLESDHSDESDQEPAQSHQPSSNPKSQTGAANE